MDHNYSIFQWDVGAAGSFIHCMSDFVRYDIPFSEDYLPENAFRPDVTTQLVDDIPYNNEFKAGLRADELKNWYTNPPGNDTRIKCVEEIKKNGVSDHIKMHWLSFETEEYFGETFAGFNYKRYIKIQATSPRPFILMHIKRMGRDPFKTNEFTKFITDTNRAPLQDKILKKYFEVITFREDDLFSYKGQFNDILRLLSGKDTIPDILWEYAKEYNNRNEKLIDWARKNTTDICKYYSDYYWSHMSAF